MNGSPATMADMVETNPEILDAMLNIERILKFIAAKEQMISALRREIADLKAIRKAYENVLILKRCGCGKPFYDLNDSRIDSLCVCGRETGRSPIRSA